MVFKCLNVFLLYSFQISDSFLLSKTCGLSKLDVKDQSFVKSDAKFGEFPWMVSIQLRGQHFCGGSIINNRWILTAGHCAMDIIKFTRSSKNSSVVQLIIGTIDRYNRNLSYSIEKVVINKCMKIYGTADIAIIKTTDIIEFLKTGDTFVINSVCLPNGNPIALKTFFSGWGRYSANNSREKARQPEFLKKSVMGLSSPIKCQAFVLIRSLGLYSIPSNIVCVFNSNSTTCEGDSGGPLVQLINNRWHILGIASLGFSGCAPTDPVIYTNINSYINWIEMAINNSDIDINQMFLFYGCEQYNRFIHQLKRLTRLIVKQFIKIFNFILLYVSLIFRLFSK